MECCGGENYEKTFTDRFARRTAKGIRAKGLDPVRRRLVDFLVERDIEGATVLEIGGGVGELQVELLRRGAATATNLEITGNYEEEAAKLIDEAGVASRVTRRFVDIARSPDEVAAADLVVLHRVVCCYPDYEALLSAAGDHARRLLVFSFPTRNLVTRLVLRFENLQRRVRGNSFQSFVHPPEAMIATAEAHGLVLRYRHSSAIWSVAGFERAGAHG